jgi:hypothetical protein
VKLIFFTCGRADLINGWGPGKHPGSTPILPGGLSRDSGANCLFNRRGALTVFVGLGH